MRARLCLSSLVAGALACCAVHLDAPGGAATLRLGGTDATAEPAAWYEGRAGQRRVRRLIGAASGGLLYLASETVLKDALAADDCRWCAPPGFDRSVRDALVWSDRERARRLSDATGYLATPLFAVGITAVMAARASVAARSRFSNVLDDTLPVVEAVVYSQLLVQVAKFAVARQRPGVRFATEPRPASNDDNLSFFSGHSALGFALTTSAGIIARRRGYRTEAAVWSVGFGLAATTGFLRIAADKHYLSDVLTGAAFGAAAGYAVPQLLDVGGGRHQLALQPTARGVALHGVL